MNDCLDKDREEKLQPERMEYAKNELEKLGFQITYQDKTIVYAADLLPTVGHIPLPYVMGYDTRPLLTLNEKERFLNEAAANNYYLFMEHDAHHEIITVQNTEKGVRLKEIFTFAELFS